MKAALALEDGTVIIGRGFGSKGERYGEIVFCTSMTGYQEALTDPSYKGQILIFTYPLIGNYGIHDVDNESSKIQVEGLVIRELTHPYHYSMSCDLDNFLKKYEIPAICDIDTRALVIKIREFGTMKAGIMVKEEINKRDISNLLNNTIKQPDISEIDLVSKVTRKQPVTLGKGKIHLVLIDCGVKKSIVDELINRGIKITIVPAFYDKKKILNFEPDGILVSNGPGDPKKADYVIKTVRDLIKEELPIFGICLGHQIIALALGGETYKLKFGHRGSNHPVKDLNLDRVYITTQNHGYAVSYEKLDEIGLKVFQINLNDGSIEAMCHENLPIISTQYHPEANPGPFDTRYIFDIFLKYLKGEEVNIKCRSEKILERF